ncbi:MAG: glycosyltransferase family 87 protein [Xanthobacteraceae bacterium]
MAFCYQMFSARDAGARLSRPVQLICVALVLVNAALFGHTYVQDLLAPRDAVSIYDFVTTWSAGHMALTGHAAAVYDWPSLKHVDESVLGHPFDGYLGWPYPPPFFFIIAAVSLFPYAIAFVVWILGTFLAYLAAIRAIIGDRVGYLLACAFPAVVANAVVGQNGFLSAALIGGSLSLMEQRPICAGALLGLLTYKPHLGILFPIALLASGRWRVFVSAGIVAVLMAAASAAVFGFASWQEFFSSIGYALYANGMEDWGKLQSVFGVTLTLGGSETLAWTVQIVVALIATGIIAIVWRSRAAFELKAAALGVGTLLAAPHLFAYDLAILAVPLAFLIRLGRTDGFLPHEMGGIGLACLLILLLPAVRLPVGLTAVLVVAALIVMRALATGSVRPWRPSPSAGADARRAAA